MKRVIIVVLFAMLSAITSQAKQHVVEIIDFAFKPANLNIAAGDTVTWINKSISQHTSTSGSDCKADGIWNSGTMDAGDKFTHVFKSAGNFSYYCIPHCTMNMTGSISVSGKTSSNDGNDDKKQNNDQGQNQNSTQPEMQPDKPKDEHQGHSHLIEKSTFRNTRIVNAQSVETLHSGILEFRVVHRWDNLTGERGGPHLFFGLDNLRDERLSLEYGITDNLMAGFGRSKGDYYNNKIQQVQELFDLFIKYRLLRQDNEKHMPLSLTLHANSVVTGLKPRRSAGNEANFQSGADRWSFVVQPIIARKFSQKLSLEILPTYLRRNWAVNGDEQDLFSIGAGGSLHFTKRFGIVAEYFYPFSDYRKNNSTPFYNPLALGVEFNTGGHIFTINLSNSTGIIENTFIPYTNTSWLKDGYRLGFSIHRKFNLDKKN